MTGGIKKANISNSFERLVKAVTRDEGHYRGTLGSFSELSLSSSSSSFLSSSHHQDHGFRSVFWLNARELSIAWNDDPRYWEWKSVAHEPRFSEVVELKKVSWFDIRGKMQAKMLSRKTNYAAFLVFKIINNGCFGLESISKSSVNFVNSLSGDESDSTYLIPRPCEHQTNQEPSKQCKHCRFPRKRYDGWMEIHLGDIFNDEGEGEIEMRIFETEIPNWKGGLIVGGIELWPKSEVF